MRHAAPFGSCTYAVRAPVPYAVSIAMRYHESMYPDWYAKVSAPFRSAMGVEAIRLIDKALVVLIALVYVAAAAFMAFTGDMRLIRLLVVPAIVLIAVSIVRSALNAPRPYELYDIDPIIQKSTRGKSFPSRHVACAVVIACALMWIHADWGVITFIGALGLAFTRIVGGVHFPRDVVAAAVFALVVALLGFVLVP